MLKRALFAVLATALVAVAAGCSEETLIGATLRTPDLVLVQQTPIEPPTGALGQPLGTPKIQVTVRNRGEGTAYFPNVELRLKQGGTIIEAARGTFPRLEPGETARETVWLHEAETHQSYDTIDCRLRWLNARDRGFSTSC